MNSEHITMSSSMNDLHAALASSSGVSEDEASINSSIEDNGSSVSGFGDQFNNRSQSKSTGDAHPETGRVRVWRNVVLGLVSEWRRRL